MEEGRKEGRTDLTSNDIIAGNGRILIVYEYCVVITTLKFRIKTTI